MFRLRKIPALLVMAGILYALMPAFSFAEEAYLDEPAPLNPEFLRWPYRSESYAVPGIDGINGQTYGGGDIPSPIDRSYLLSNPPRPKSRGPENLRDSDYPVSYDIRAERKLPAIRSQSPFGTCWAHAAIGSMESSYLTTYDETSPDLSEMHLAYFVYGDTRPGKSFSPYYDDEGILDQGGNADQAIAFLSKGTVSESVLPYPTSKSFTSPDKLPEEYESSGIRLKAAYTLPNLLSQDLETRELVKGLITEIGGVKISYYAGAGAHTPVGTSTTAYFNNLNGTRTNHAVLIVGWDDEFSRENFDENMRPEIDGAWLVRNSWGPNWGDHGYFWMSYQQHIASPVVFIGDVADKNLKHYGYDDLGRGGSTSRKWNANIFRTDGAEYLKYVGFQTVGNNTDYSILVYDLGTTSPDSPVSGTIIARVDDGYAEYEGYHTVEFEDRLKIEAGHYFSVVMNTSNGMALEMAVNWSNGKPYAAPVCNSGESYGSSNGTSWSGLTNNVCIKAFTIPIGDLVVEVNSTNFPDENFREHVSSAYDTNEDGWLSNLEIKAVTSIELPGGDEITSLKGLEYFTSLEYFSSNGIVMNFGLDFSANTALKVIDVHGCLLPSLDVSANTALVSLDCGTNKLTVLDVSKNVALKHLDCSDNRLIQLDLTANTALTYLNNRRQRSFLYLAEESPDVDDEGVGLYYVDLKKYVSDISRIVPGTVKENSYYQRNANYNSQTGIVVLTSATDEISYGYNPGHDNTDPATTDSEGDYMDVAITRWLTITTEPKLPDTTRRANYSVTFEAENEADEESPVWELMSGDIPPGLTLSSDGKLTGVLTTVGDYSFNLKASTPEAGAFSRNFTLKVTETKMSGTLASTLTRKAVYSKALNVTGGASPYSWSVASGALPDGLSLNTSTGAITGTATKAGTFSFTVKVSDKNGADDTKQFTMTVTETTLTDTIAETLTRRASYTKTLTATGGKSPYSWRVSSGALPDGLTLNASTGKISGSATKAGTFSFTIKAKDSNGAAATKKFTMTVTQTTLTGTLASTLTRKASYSKVLKATGGKSPYTWSVSAGALPDGLKLGASTGKINGQATKAGTFSFTIKAKDSNGAAASKKFTLKVTQTTLTGTLASTLTRRASYTKTLKATGGKSPYAWSVSAGTLPDGLKLGASTGKITGSVTKAGTFSFTIKAKDSNGAAASKKFTLKVTQTTVSGTIPATGTVGSSYTGTPKATKGLSPYVWSVSSGKLPTGLKLNTSTGAITGTLKKAGTFTFTLKAKDVNGAAGTKKYTVKVIAATSTQSVEPEGTNDAPSSGNPDTQDLPATQGSPETVAVVPGDPAGTFTLTATLNVASDDVLEAGEGRDSDLITVRAGKTLTFILGDWGLEVSGVTVYVDDEPAGAVTVAEDGTFTLPAEMVEGDFKVCVKATHDGSELESETLYIISQN